MKAFALSMSYVVLYAAAGAAFLWASVWQGTGFYALSGAAFLALAVWEVRAAIRAYRKGRTERPGWLTMSVGYIIMALSYIYRSIAEPTGFNVGIAVCWSILGVLYARKAVRELRAADTKKEEAS